MSGSQLKTGPQVGHHEYAEVNRGPYTNVLRRYGDRYHPLPPTCGPFTLGALVDWLESRWADTKDEVAAADHVRRWEASR